MVPADATDAAAIDVLHDLTIPNEWHAEIIAAAEAILHHDQTVPTVDRADIEAQLRRLGTVYADGLINDLDYRRQRDALRMQLAQVVPAHVPDVAAAAQVLHNLPSLVATATLEQRRALIATIFSTFWLEKPMGIKAITPTGLYLPLVGVIMLGADGVADGFRTRNPRNHNPMLCR